MSGPDVSPTIGLVYKVLFRKPNRPRRGQRLKTSQQRCCPEDQTIVRVRQSWRGGGYGIGLQGARICQLLRKNSICSQQREMLPITTMLRNASNPPCSSRCRERGIENQNSPKEVPSQYGPIVHCVPSPVSIREMNNDDNSNKTQNSLPEISAMSFPPMLFGVSRGFRTSLS